MSDELCGVIGSTGEPCRLRAGAGTDHQGEGPCHLHSEDGAGLCWAKRRRRTERCRRPAGWGTSHAGFGRCKLHGGCAPNGIAAGERLQAEAKIEKIGRSLAVRPAEALLRAVWLSAGQVHNLRQQIAAAEPGSEEVRALVRAEAGERRTMAQTAKMALDAGVEQDMATHAEMLARVALSTIEAVLDRLNLPPGERERVPGLIDEALAAQRPDEHMRQIVPGQVV